MLLEVRTSQGLLVRGGLRFRIQVKTQADSETGGHCTTPHQLISPHPPLPPFLLFGSRSNSTRMLWEAKKKIALHVREGRHTVRERRKRE